MVLQGGWLNTSVTSRGLSGVREIIRRYSLSSWKRWLGRHLWISTHRYSCRWCGIASIFIDGQAECALRRHLDSLGPDTPMRDIVDICRVWESHIEVASSQQVGLDRHSPRAVCQDSQSPAVLTGSETLEEIMGRLCCCRRCRLRRWPYSIGPGAAHTALAGGNTAIPASDTGVV